MYKLILNLNQSDGAFALKGLFLPLILVLVSVNGEIVKILNIPIGNLGSVFDPSMNMAAHVSKAVKSANYYL